jgi:gluconate 2-dehydrogenase gamma chain
MSSQTVPGDNDSVALTYFNDHQARTIEAITERIIPANGADAGATQAGVVYYIDRTITGFSTGLQRTYRLGLRELDTLCDREHSKQFVNLTEEQQDSVLRRFLGSETGGGKMEHPAGLVQSAPEEADPVQAGFGSGGRTALELLRFFFAVVREHTVEGYFCDPIYGGNRGAVGWRLVGFPGTQWGYTAEQMKPGFDASVIPIKTLSDLRRELKNLPDNKRYYASEGK